MLDGGWWPEPGDVVDEQPLIPASEGPRTGVESATARHAARILVLRAGRSAQSLAAATEISTSNTTQTQANAAGTRAGGQPAVAAAE